MDAFGGLPPDCKLVSLEVCSLYTCIPNPSGLRAVYKALNKLRPGNVKPSNNSMMKLMELVLTNNFTFNGKYGLQIGGTAISSKANPGFALTLKSSSLV